MKFINLAIYILLLRLYYIGVWVTACFKPKAKRWIEGRSSVWNKLSAIPKDKKKYWFHCASLGEFEQARTLIEKIKSENPNVFILLTFYSPSGYEVRKNYPLADLVTYLPTDTAANAKRFMDLVQPYLAFFVRYDFWYFTLRELYRRNIPTVLISSSFRPKQLFFQWYGHLHKSILHYFTHIFVANESSLSLLSSINISHASFASDTRFDRVFQISRTKKTIDLANAFTANEKVVVAGSTWEEDEAFLIRLINENSLPDFKFIIAPHNLSEQTIAAIENQLQVKHIRYSQAKPESVSENRVLLIDNIGLLSRLYAYGSIAYVGGGFGKSVHNTLEPAVYGIPIIFGPNYGKQEEASELVGISAAFSFRKYDELKMILRNLSEFTLYYGSSRKAMDYVLLRIGGSEKIYRYLQEQKLL